MSTTNWAVSLDNNPTVQPLDRGIMPPASYPVKPNCASDGLSWGGFRKALRSKKATFQFDGASAVANISTIGMNKFLHLLGIRAPKQFPLRTVS